MSNADCYWHPEFLEYQEYLQNKANIGALAATARDAFETSFSTAPSPLDCSTQTSAPSQPIDGEFTDRNFFEDIELRNGA